MAAPKPSLKPSAVSAVSCPPAVNNSYDVAKSYLEESKEKRKNSEPLKFKFLCSLESKEK